MIPVIDAYHHPDYYSPPETYILKQSTRRFADAGVLWSAERVYSTCIHDRDSGETEERQKQNELGGAVCQRAGTRGFGEGGSIVGLGWLHGGNLLNIFYRAPRAHFCRGLKGYRQEGQIGLRLAQGETVIVTRVVNDEWYYGYRDTSPSTVGYFPRSFVAVKT